MAVGARRQEISHKTARRRARFRATVDAQDDHSEAFLLARRQRRRVAAGRRH